jgi:sugar-specific transcriptional regulator TrmB
MGPQQPSSNVMAGGDEAVKALVELGLTLNEARCYVALLHLTPATAAQLADAAAVPRPKVYGAVKALEQRGFCYTSGDRVTAFNAVEPELALSEWSRRREHERRLADHRDGWLSDQLVHMLPAPTAAPPQDMTKIMQLTGGAKPTIEVYERVIETAERRVDITHAIPVLQVPERWNRFEVAALERRVRVRVLFTSRELAIRHRCEELLAAGGEVRVARSAPLKLVVRDDGAEGLVGLSNPAVRDSPTCVSIRHAELAAPLQLLFNREWRAALRVRLGPAGRPVTDEEASGGGTGLDGDGAFDDGLAPAEISDAV